MAQHPGTEWRVTRTEEHTRFDPQHGDAVHGLTVYFETGAGNHGSVFVPDTDLLPDRAREVITEYAARVDAINELDGQPAQAET